MRTIQSGAVAGLLLLAFGSVWAQAPAGSTGECKDGTYTTQETKKGACAGHGGVKNWTGPTAAKTADTKTKSDSKAPAEKPAASKAQEAKSDTKPAAAMPAAAPATKTPPTPAATAAPGGGPGKVWANESTKVYHCPGDRWYGKTKEGSYMSEADAKAKGLKADHGKACAS